MATANFQSAHYNGTTAGVGATRQLSRVQLSDANFDCFVFGFVTECLLLGWFRLWHSKQEATYCRRSGDGSESISMDGFIAL